MPGIVIPLNITPKTQQTASPLQGFNPVAAYHKLTQPANWWQKGMTSMLPGWKPPSGSNLTPPWSPTPINTPVDWATAYGRGIPTATPRPAPIASPPGFGAMQSLVNANKNLWQPSRRTMKRAF